MCDAGLDLSLALDSSSTLDSMKFGTDRPDVVKGEAVSDDLRNGDALEGKVQMSRPLGLRQVANIIVALKRVKHRRNVMSTMFTDQELLNFVMDSVFDERVVVDMQNPTCNGGSTFWRSHNVDVVYSVCNPEQRRLVLNPDNLELHAVALHAMTLMDEDFSKRIVKLSLSTYRAFHISATQGQPVALGIAKTTLYMSCAMNSGTPILQLEKVDNKENLAKIHAQGEQERFLFFKRGSGFASTTFESAKFKGWYISTAPACDAPLEMCTQQAADQLTTFMVKRPESFDRAFI